MRGNCDARGPVHAGLRIEAVRRLGGLALLAVLAGCAARTPPDGTLCREIHGKPAIVAALFFGQNISGRGAVSETEWARFLEQAVVPRVQGFTVLDGSGGWLDPRTHAVATEKTKILVVSAGGDKQTLGTLRRIAELYKVRFDQKSVGLVVMNACSSFDE